MKKIYLFALAFFTCMNLSWAQTNDGDVFDYALTGTDINGATVDVQADLAAGKTVILDFFTTWCGPCWAVHEQEILKNLYEKYGPDAADQLRIYAIESDPSTTMEDLTSQTDKSYGDWTEGVAYTIMDDEKPAMDLEVGGFPTLLVIRPEDKKVVNFFNYILSPEYIEVLVANKQDDMIMSNAPASGSFCETLERVETFSLKNISLGEVSSFKLSVNDNGVEEVLSFDETVGIYQNLNVELPAKTIDANLNREVKLIEVNGNAIESKFYNNYTSSYIRPILETATMNIKFTTDYFPSETSWQLKDDNTVFLEVSYTGDGNGGGDDALKTFDYSVEIPSDALPCLRFEITDAFGDGMSVFEQNGVHPGIEVFDANNNLIKDKLSSEQGVQAGEGTVYATSYIFNAESVDVPEVEAESLFKVYPTLTSDLLYIDADQNIELVEIYNNTGQKVNTIKTVSGSIDMSHLQNGVYSIHVYTAGQVASTKVIKL